LGAGTHKNFKSLALKKSAPNNFRSWDVKKFKNVGPQKAELQLTFGLREENLYVKEKSLPALPATPAQPCP
jgi:hypothetical protein